MKPFRILTGVILVSVLLVGCAAGINEQVNTSNAQGMIAGFWRGLWHGLIAPIAFIVSLFDRTVQVYEVHNNGTGYNFGFILGMMMLHGHAARGGPRRTTNRGPTRTA